MFQKIFNSPMDKTLVIGCGSIGQRHINNLLYIQRQTSSSFTVDAVEPDDTNRERASQLGCGTVYHSLEQAFDQSDYQTVVICSPNHHHVPQAIAALHQGCYVFVEKPLALNLNEAQKMAPLVKAYSGRLMVGCNLRFHKGVRSLRETIKGGLVGKPLYAKAHFAHYLPNWRPGVDYRNTYSALSDQGGGILLDAVHELDYLNWIFGKVKEVQGRLMNLGDLEIQVEDTAAYHLQYESGVFGEVHVDYLRRDKSRGCIVVCKEGSIVWESTAKNPETLRVKVFHANENEWELLFEDTDYDLNTQYIDEMSYFLSAAANGNSLMNGIDEAIYTMEILDDIRDSSAKESQMIKKR